jgi:undecaprenyl-diphosphatase
MFTSAPRQLLLVCALFLSGFLLVAALRTSFTQVDAYVNSWATSIHTSFLTITAEVVSFAFDTNTLLVLSLFTAICLFYKRFLTEGVLLLSAMGANALCVETAKILVHSSRPLNGLVQETGYSFPSGHASATVVYLSLLAYFAWLHLKNVRVKNVLNVVFAVVAALVGFDRVYLNAHWLSDVIGGYMLGAFWATLSILVIQHLKACGKNHERTLGFRRTCSLSPYSHYD